MVRKLLIGCVLLFGWSLVGQAQWSLRNNLLYDAALTPNLSGEVRVKPKWTLALNLGFSPFETGTNSTRRWRHVLVMPEARYWFCEAYSHHFLSVNAVYSHYNVAKLDLPLYCGEYGVIDRAPAEDSARWYKDIHKALAAHGIGRALWSYKEMDFGIMGQHYAEIRQAVLA